MAEDVKIGYVGNGKIDAMGISIDITSELGKQIVSRLFEQLTEEQTQKLVDFVMEDLFNKSYGGEFTTVKTGPKDWYGNQKELTLADNAKKELQAAFREMIREKTEKIIHSEEYQKEADKIATEIVEYATEGYKEDLKTRIRERMINNVFAPTPSYNGESLLGIINQVINDRFHM